MTRWVWIRSVQSAPVHQERHTATPLPRVQLTRARGIDAPIPDAEYMKNVS